MKKKVIIIGAGPAGLTAGLELLNRSKEYDVLILEESSSIGGISKTVKYKGNRMDIGGHRFFSKFDRVNNFWKDLLPVQGKPSYDDKKLNSILQAARWYARYIEHTDMEIYLAKESQEIVL